MIGQYLRVTPSELAKALDDPDWAIDLAAEILNEEEERELTADVSRHLSTDKVWHALAYLLHRAGFPVDVVYGESPLGAEDWGNGPAHYLTPAEVAEAATALAALPYEKLVEGIEPADLNAADIYPLDSWTSPAALDWPRPWYEALPPYFQSAATAGDALILWLD
jgi:hypothetical protein